MMMIEEPKKHFIKAKVRKYTKKLAVGTFSQRA